jgi:hypothetical protein
MTNSSNKQNAKRSGKMPNTRIEPKSVHFTSRGAVGGSSAVGNFDLLMDTAGSPFTSDQGGSYGLTSVALDLRAYFSQGVFGAYDYYRVEDVETTVTWITTPTNGVSIAGEILYCYDNDSRDEVTLTEVANRETLQTRTFTNNKIRHVMKWNPYLVEDSSTEGVSGAQVDYIQPRSRWLNTANVDLHRFGTMRLIGSNFSSSNGYPAESARLQIRHRVKIAMKGLKSTQIAPTSLKSELQL